MAVNIRNQTIASDAGIGPGVIIGPATTNLTLTTDGRYLTVSTAGTITGKLVGDTGDQAYVFPIGTHKISFRSITSVATLVGFITL